MVLLDQARSGAVAHLLFQGGRTHQIREENGDQPRLVPRGLGWRITVGGWNGRGGHGLMGLIGCCGPAPPVPQGESKTPPKAEYGPKRRRRAPRSSG